MSGGSDSGVDSEPWRGPLVPLPALFAAVAGDAFVIAAAAAAAVVAAAAAAVAAVVIVAVGGGD
eukprot:9515681-Alexandrium_andersonii.AAC.1